MRLASRVLLPLAFVVPLAACAEELEVDPTGWYRVERTLSGSWIIARADLETGACHLLTVSNGGAPPDFVFEDVETNVDGVLASRLFDRGDARDCQTNLSFATTLTEASASGEIRVEQTSMLDNMLNACRMDIDVTTDEVRFLAHDLYIWGSRCDPIPSETTYYTNIEAAYDDATQRLTVAGWDPVSEACGWIYFHIETEYFSEIPVDAPANWIVRATMIEVMPEDQCHAELLTDKATTPPTQWTEFGQEQWGDGTLSFVESQVMDVEGVDVEVPCEITIDAWMPFYATRYWVPARAGFRAQRVPVSGACG